MKTKKTFFLAIALIFSITLLGFSQNPTTSPNDQDEDAPLVKITTDLVQMDVVVTDKKGNQITDLKAEDFEISEDGVAQKITNFSYVSIKDKPIVKNTNPQVAPPKNLRVPLSQLSFNQARRTIAIVIDDLGLSFENTTYVRSILKDFVNKEMQEGDLIAIIYTGGGNGILQQFTYDKTQLLASIDQLKFNLYGRAGTSNFDPVTQKDPAGPAGLIRNGTGSGNNAVRTPSINVAQGQAGNPFADIENARNQSITVGSLGTLRLVVQNLKSLPGRKSILLLSDGFPVFNDLSSNPDSVNNTLVQKALGELIDQANRAALSIYTISTRGPRLFGLNAADNLGTSNPFENSNSQLQSNITNSSEERRGISLRSEDGLRILADATGGDFSVDINLNIKRALEDQNGYYLIGYSPEKPSNTPNELRKLKIKLKDKKFTVRTRKAFYSAPVETVFTPSRSDQLLEAIFSPFGLADIDLKLASFYSQDKNGQFFRALLHIDTKALNFVKEEDFNKATFDILAITYGEDGQIVDKVNRTHNIKARGETYEQILHKGFVYLLDVPTKKAGAYQLRVAIRDVNSKKLGSISQYVEVPNISIGQLVTSGIILTSEKSSTSDKNKATQINELKESDDNHNSLLTSVIREFNAGDVLKFAYQAYNVRSVGNPKPTLKYQANLFLDDKKIFTGKEIIVDLTEGVDTVPISGAFQLGKQLVPGSYVLQIITSENLGNGRGTTSEQLIDFKVKAEK